MVEDELLETAIGGHRRVPRDWMPASQVRPFILGDPAAVWLQYHGEDYGFLPDTSPYEFIDFIGEKGRQFEDKWIHELAPEALSVCVEPQDVRLARRARETVELLEQRVPVIAQPALWWAPERIYGVPDLLVHTCWLRANSLSIIESAGSPTGTPFLEDCGEPDHYVVFDFKFTTKLDQSREAIGLENYAAQVRIYTFILGHLQGLMPRRAYLIARDRIDDPLPIDISSKLGEPLDADLAAMRDQFLEIKINGSKYVPWEDEIVAFNIGGGGDSWRTARDAIAREKTPGGDVRLLYQVGTNVKYELAKLGYPNLAAILEEEPGAVPFESCRGIGPKKATQMRAIVQANRLEAPVVPPPDLIPPGRQFEFYVDFEFFSDVNVDLQTQWPTLEGCEMVFMIGVGQEDQGDWRFKVFMAEAEDHYQEQALFDQFVEYLQDETEGAILDDSSTALYHWASAEVTQARRAADRHQFAANHPLRRLPWIDLRKAFLDGPGAVPGAWNYRLKDVSKALGQLDPDFATQWPGDLDEGLRAMVMGWKAYETAHPATSEEMRILRQYLEADCRALWNILAWLRAGSA